MSGSMSGGHFLGFYAAVIGLITLVLAWSHPKMATRLGKKRLPVAVASALLLVALAFFGSGSRRITFRTALGPASGLPAKPTQAHVDAALVMAASPSFLAYLAALESQPPLDRPARLGPRLSVRLVSSFDLPAEGFDVTPKVGEAWLVASYDDEENAVLAAFDGGEGVLRMRLAERLVTDVLPDLIVVEAIRAAPTDAEKIDILRGQTLVMPHAAEHLARALDEIGKGASRALADVLASKRAYVQKYVDDPTMRGKPAGFSIAPPAP